MVRRRAAWVFLAAASIMAVPATAQAPGYVAIGPVRDAGTVTLTGDALTVDQVVRVARHGAQVALSPAARERNADTYGLMLQGAAENMPVYLFNRGAGANRAVTLFTGDPMSPENRPKLEEQALRQFRGGAVSGAGPEVAEEQVVRALMVVRANGLTYEAGSPALLQMLVDMLNAGITPVVQTRGGTGEADGPYNGNVNAAMVGAGEAYYKGERMPAAEALAAAGLKPLVPQPGNGTVSTTNAFATGQAALLVDEARALLEWTDLVYAMDLNAMNSSITPLLAPVQDNRPFPWLNWEAARVRGMIEGSYLFDADPARIIQDPESLRASAIRQGAAWQAWGRLKKSVELQLNRSDHNPVVKPGYGPRSAAGLASGQAMTYFVKGGKHSRGKSGYIFSNANWDWYPIGNDVEAFTGALANTSLVVLLRQDRFSNPFFTVVKPADILGDKAAAAPLGNLKVATDAFQDVQSLAVPVAPVGFAIISTVEDLQGQSRLKVAHAREAVAASWHVLAQDLLTASYWLDLRRTQNPARSFGPAPTAAWQAFRKVVPWGGPLPVGQIDGTVVQFMQSTPAASFAPFKDLPAE
jgi:histidine ammonia-lyase